MGGAILTIALFINGENLEKLNRIREQLNSRNDVVSGDIEPWTDTDVYNLLLNKAIEEFRKNM